jgi:Mrp family chromosome partitioning ATPase
MKNTPRISEQLRDHLVGLWDTILIDTPDPPKTLLFCGSTYGEGVTFLSYHLALLLGLEYQMRVLYVETDDGSRNSPDLLENLREGGGLAAYLSQNVPLEPLIRTTETPGFHVLPSGVRHGLAGLGGGAVARGDVKGLMHFAGGHFDIAIFDGQPLLRSPGVVRFAREAEQVIFVCRYAVSRREVSKLALDKLRECGASVLGVVLNDRQYPIPPKLYKLLK